MSIDPSIAEFSRVAPFRIGSVDVIPRQLLLKSALGETRVEPKVMALLVTLSERGRDTWTRAELIDRIWGTEFGGDESLTRAVHGLRKAFTEPHGVRNAVKTLPKVGYRLDLDVKRLRAVDVSEPSSPDPEGRPSANVQEKVQEEEGLEAIASTGETPSGILSRRSLIFASGIAALGIGALGARSFLGRATLPPQISNNLIVLPFSNETGDHALNYVASGISGEIRHSLSRNQALRVLARRSSEAIKRRDLTALEIAQEFGRPFILDGRTTLGGAALSLSVELIEAQTGITRWSEVYNAPIDQLLAVQSTITGRVSKEISEDFTNDAVLALGLPTNPAAFEIYLRAQDQLAQIRSPEDALLALSVLDRAIELDPNFALAHTTKGRWLSWVSGAENDETRAALYLNDALAAAEQGLALEPDLADTNSTLGWVRFFSALDVSGAQEPYERSIALAPNDARILARYAPYIAMVGDEERARLTIESALLLDPLNPGVHRIAAMVNYYAGRSEQALSSIEELLKLQPNAVVAQYWKGRAQIAIGDPARAIETCELEPNLDAKLSCQGVAYAKADDVLGANGAIEALSEEYGDKAAYQQAQILASQGRDDQAMQALQKAWQKRDPGLVSLKVDTVFENLRARQDYLRLLESIGFDT